MATLESSTGHAAADRRQVLTEQGPVLFFDGVCGLCNRFVDFVMARDRNGVFRFAPLQGSTADGVIDSDDAASLKSVVLIDETGTYRKSTAIVRVLRHLGGVWAVVGRLLWLVPRPLRDVGYGSVAAIRYHVFGRHETCRMPTPEERARLLP